MKQVAKSNEASSLACSSWDTVLVCHSLIQGIGMGTGQLLDLLILLPWLCRC